MSLKLVELQNDAEFEELAKVEFDAFEQPDCRLKNLFFPTHGTGVDARDTAIREAAQRQASWHRADATSQWFKVIDVETGKVLGAACWHIYENNPYDSVSEEECDWFAKGEDRDVANSLMEQFLTPRRTYMRKPHLFLDMCFTHPDARRRGVGKLLLEWGIYEADKRNYDMYIDATDMGRLLYRTFGFVEAPPIELTTIQFDRTDRLRELENQLLPYEWWPMYRPVSKRHDESDARLPWETSRS